MNKTLFIIFIMFLGVGVVFSQSITVTSPNGGESWVRGSNHNITWNASNLTNDVKITLWKNDVFVGLIVKDVNPNLGTYQWIVGKHTTGNASYGITYKVKIREQGGASFTTEDSSNGNFAINPIRAGQPGTRFADRQIVLTPRPSLKLVNKMIGFLPGKCNKVKFSVDIVNKGGASLQTNPKFRLEINGPPGPFDNYVINGTLTSCGNLAPNASCNFTRTYQFDVPGMYYFTFKIDPMNEINQYKKVTEQIVQQKPDLITYIPNESARLAIKKTIKFYVKNQGRACSKPFVLRTYMKKKGSKNHNIPSLRPGDIYLVKRTAKWFTVGTKTLKAHADYGKTIDEGQFENNNTFEASVVVKAYKYYVLTNIPEGFFKGIIINPH